jgi:hypothetical protein
MTAAKSPIPRVYAAINAITSELATCGIAKLHRNASDGYRFRGIDDVMQALAPLLARHRLCILPRVLAREASERTGEGNKLLSSVSLHVAFDLVSARDGSTHSIEVSGEALDAGDKATAKAMSAAWKQAMVQAFCIPSGQSDTESEDIQLQQAQSHNADPVQGWDQWSRDLCELFAGCTSEDAVLRVQSTYRDQLRTLSRRRPDLFALVGRTIAEQRKQDQPALSKSNLQSGPGMKPVRGNSPVRGLAIARDPAAPQA